MNSFAVATESAEYSFRNAAKCGELSEAVALTVRRECALASCLDE